MSCHKNTTPRNEVPERCVTYQVPDICISDKEGNYIVSINYYLKRCFFFVLLVISEFILKFAA